MITPLGLAWRNGYVRCLKSTFDKKYLISEMKRNARNIMPIVVLDDITKKSKCYLINDDFTDFDIITDLSGKILCKKIDDISDYMINKLSIQKLNIDDEVKELKCLQNELINYSKLDNKGIEKYKNSKIKELKDQLDLLKDDDFADLSYLSTLERDLRIVKKIK